MHLFKTIFITLAMVQTLLAFEINHHTASQLASDAYLSPQEFVEKYPKYTISTSVTYGVRYYILENTQHTIITIMGTNNTRNLITNITAREHPFLDDETILVHEGFYDVAKKIFQTIKLDTSKNVVVTGHSLGGAVALLYSAMLYEKGIDITLYTFGMPPIVNKAFLKKYSKLNHYRHFHIFDPIVSLSKPTIELFEVQKKFKDFLASKDTIDTMIHTIQTIPDKFRHHGITNAIKTQIQSSTQQAPSLFYKTCTIYFEYHKIQNYIQALMQFNQEYLKVQKETLVYEQPKVKRVQKYIKVIPSLVEGTTPLEVEFYIDTQGVDLSMYYFDFEGKEILKESLEHNKISHTFTKSGQNRVKIALKDTNGRIIETQVIITTRKPTFKEYQEAFGKEYEKFMQEY
jgi:hypothetical protein